MRGKESDRIYSKIKTMPGMNLKTVKALHLRENFQEIYKESTKGEFEGAFKK